MPGFLLKAKGAITKGIKAAKTANNARSFLKSKDNDQSEKTISPTILGLIVLPAAFVIVFLILFISIIAYPLIIANEWLGGNSASASVNNSSDWDELYFNQSNGPWSNVSYDAGGGTIAAAGCGLVSITHVIDILTGSNFTPDQINDQLRDYYNNNISEYAPGGSSVPKLVEFAVGKYGLKSTHYDNVDDAIADMSSGAKVIICSDNGNSDFLRADGSTYRANHVIMAYKTDGNNVWVKDSGTANGNSIKYTKEQFAGIDFVGWYVLSK